MENHILNGTSDGVSELSIRNRKSIVTYAGDRELFLSLESILTSSLPKEPAEWSRSHGRAVKSVNVAATFVPFSKDLLPSEGSCHLIDQPMFHTFWTQCSDIDAYKTNVREEIDVWMRTLTQYNVEDWMIVLVETYDFRKTNKLLPRTTVFDKIKSDYGVKHSNRCISVINPLRSESRSASSWKSLVHATRVLLLTAYNKTLTNFEEKVRKQREGRNKIGWSFTKYFLLQEELAFVLEMLGVYEEALVQYDELDALFTQFVLNSNLGETPAWLSQFQSPLDSWAGVCISPEINIKERAKIESNTISLLQFRNYLFSRQCSMLLYVNKPWEVAERTLPFLHNCIRELSLLEVSCMPASVACWVFLSCIEILLTCESFTESSEVEQYSPHTAGLWAYACQKLSELGNLCGLMPGQKQSSQQLHAVVEILSGLGDDNTKPVERLKKALSSPQEFCKQYLELSELAMGTYKHIGRVRCARAIGNDLAKFYWSIGDYNTATSYLQSTLHCYEQDGWKQLAAQTRLQLAQSYLKVVDVQRYVKTCLSVACSSELDMETRLKHYDSMVETLKTSNPDPPWAGVLSDCLSLTDIDIQVDKGSSKVTATLGIMSFLPVETTFSSISISVAQSKQEKQNKSEKSSSRHKDKDQQENHKRKSKEDLRPKNPLLQKLAVNARLDYQQDWSLAKAHVEIKNEKQILRRQDSHGKYRKVSSITKNDFTNCLRASNLTLKTGSNKITLESEENEPGLYSVGQCCAVLLNKLDLLSLPSSQKVYFEVVKTPPKVTLTSSRDELLAGLHQTLDLTVNSGSSHIPKGSIVKLKTTQGLSLQLQESSDKLGNRVEVPLPEILPNNSMTVPLQILAQLPFQKESHPIEHTVFIESPWSDEEDKIGLSLQPAIFTSWRVHTSKMSKYVHVTVTGLSPHVMLSVKSPKMSVLSPSGVTLVPSNASSDAFVIGKDKRVSYMWKVNIDEGTQDETIKTEFSLHYQISKGEGMPRPIHLYKCTYDISNYKTLYIIECKVEPVRGSEFCRVSTVCQLLIKVSKAIETSDTNLQYEVQAEHNMWAVCGRTAGVLCLESVNEQTVTVEVMPLINGYLPLPSVKLAKYIPAHAKNASGRSEGYPRVEPFSPGQVYTVSKGAQVHVIAAVSPQNT